MLNLSVAVSRRVKKGDEWVDEPIWTDVTLFGKRCQWLHDHMRTGTLIEAVGELSLREYTGKDGEKRTQVELFARDIRPLDKFESRTADASSSNVRGEHRDDFRGNSRNNNTSRPPYGERRYGNHGDYVPQDDVPF